MFAVNGRFMLKGSHIILPELCQAGIEGQHKDLIVCRYTGGSGIARRREVTYPRHLANEEQMSYAPRIKSIVD